jgi:chromosome segregation ATPase
VPNQTFATTQRKSILKYYTVPHDIAAAFVTAKGIRDLATQKNVTTAFNFLRSIGVTPSVRELIHVLGGGSSREVGPFLKVCLAEEAEAQAAQSQVPGISLDVTTIHRIEELISSFALAASAAADQEIKNLTKTNAELSEELTTADILAENLQDDIATCNVQLQQQAGQLEARLAEIARVREASAESLREAQLNFVNERRIADDLRQQVELLRLDAASLPELKRQADLVSDQLRDVTKALHEAQQAAAVAVAERAAVSIRAREYFDRELAALDRIEKLEVQLSDAASLEHDLVDAVREAEKCLSLAETRLAVLEVTHASHQASALSPVH